MEAWSDKLEQPANRILKTLEPALFLSHSVWLGPELLVHFPPTPQFLLLLGNKAGSTCFISSLLLLKGSAIACGGLPQGSRRGVRPAMTAVFTLPAAKWRDLDSIKLPWSNDLATPHSGSLQSGHHPSTLHCEEMVKELIFLSYLFLICEYFNEKFVSKHLQNQEERSDSQIRLSFR